MISRSVNIPASPAPFLVDKHAIQQGYVTSEPLVIEQAGGFKPKLFLLADSGYSTYGALVLAPRSWVEQKPEIVRAFVGGVDRGLAGSYLNGNPGAGGRRADPARQSGHDTRDTGLCPRQSMAAHGIVRFRRRTKTLGIGAMTDARWAELFKLAVALGLYPADLDYRKAYVLDFVNKGFGLPERAP